MKEEYDIVCITQKGNVSEQQVIEKCNNNGLKINSELVTEGCRIVLDAHYKRIILAI